MSTPKPGTCTACPQDGRYCAPNRCYCGHEECTSYATGYVERKPLTREEYDRRQAAQRAREAERTAARTRQQRYNRNRRRY